MMEQSALFMNKKECQAWLKTISDAEKHKALFSTLKIRVLAPYLFGEDFLPQKWRKWMEEARFKTYIDKWLEVEPIDVGEYEKFESLAEFLNLLALQILANGVDRFMNLAVRMDKETNLAKAKALAHEEASFVRIWELLSPSNERSKVALMAVVFSYIRFAGETVRKRDHLREMTFVNEKEQGEIETFKAKGNEEHKLEHYSRAVTQYNKAIRKSRYCPTLYSNRCMAFLNMKKFNHAMMDAKRTLILDPTWTKASYRYAQAMFELGYHKRAMTLNAATLEQCKRENATDPYITNLESQKDSFQTRRMERVSLDAVPDLVDPSSSDSSDVDSDEQEAQIKNILKSSGVHEKDKTRRSKVTIIDDDCGVMQIPKSVVKSKSKDRKRMKTEEDEPKKTVKQEQKAEKVKEVEEIKHREKPKFVHERKKRETHAPAEPKKGSGQVKLPDEGNELDKQLQLGSEAMLEHRGRQAFAYYKAAMDLMGMSSKQYGGQREEDYVIFLYAYGMACLESGIDEEITDACHKFEMILENHSRIRSPLPYYGLSCALFKLNKFKDALEPLEKAKHMAKRFPIVVETWPGTKHKISETEEGQMMIVLKRLEDICKQPPPPDATCRFESCPLKPEMYLTDVGFKGYVRVQCKERCHMDFHITCWKKIKAEEYPNVTHEKELLMKDCRTPDCDGVYVKVTVYGHDGLPKTEHQTAEAVKTKEKRNKGVKQQAKKTRKKPEVSKKQQKSEKGQDDDEEQEEKAESKKSSMETASVASTSTADMADGDDEIEEDEEEEDDIQDVQVEAKHLLKKDDLQEESVVRAVKPKTKKKKGKDEASTPVKELLDAVKQALYSSENVKDKNGNCPGAQSYPTLDPENPFATPPHLQEAASDLERNFKPSKIPHSQNSQTEEEMNQIAVLHMHFEEVVGRLGPVPISYSKLGDELQQLPEELQNIVERFGGLSKFLLKSDIFTMIEDYICLQRDSVKCQDLLDRSNALKFVGDPKLDLRQLSKDLEHICGSLAPENFPNIREMLAGNIMEQKCRRHQSSSTTRALDEIYVDTPESKENGTQPAVDEDRFHDKAVDQDKADKDKIEIKSEKEAGADISDVQHGAGQQKSSNNQEKEPKFPTSSSTQRMLTKEENEAFLDRTEKEILARERGEPVEQYTGGPTVLNSRMSIMDQIFSLNRTAKSSASTNNTEKPKAAGNLTEKVQLSVFSADAKPFVPSSARKMNLNSNDSQEKPQSLDSVSKNKELQKEDTKPASDPQSHSKPVISENESGFCSSSASGESAESSLQNEQSLDSVRSVRAGVSNADRNSDSGSDGKTLHESDEGTCVDLIPDATRKYGVPSDKSNELSSSADTCSTAENTPMPDSKSSSETELVADSSASVATCTSNSASVDNSTSDNQSSSDTKHTSAMNSSSETLPESDSKPTDNTTSTTNDTCNATPMSATTSTCHVTSTSQTNATAVTIPTTSAASSTTQTTNSETAPPLANSQNSSNVSVSLDKYNNLLQKYTTLFNVCKTAADVKKAMKCTWTQYPKVTLRSRAINTGPDKILEGCRANEMRLHRNLRDTNEKFARLKDRYDCDIAKLRDDLKQLNAMNSQYEHEQARHSQQLRDVKQSRDAENMRLMDELKSKDSTIQSLDAKITSLTKQLTSKDELLESTIQSFQTERDLWTAEKLKLEEASGNLERNQQMLVKRCQESEIGVLNLRCAKDVNPIEAVIREGEFHVNNCRTILQRNIPVSENMKEFLALWEKCNKDNNALLAAHKAKYEELIQQVKKGVPLHQLQPPKSVRPFKGPQPMRPSGVRVPFGPPGPQGPTHQQQPQPNQMPAKMPGVGGVVVGFPNQQQTDPRLPVTSANQDNKTAAPVQGHVPTPSVIPVTTGASVHAPVVMRGQAQVQENPAQQRPGVPVQNWNEGNVNKVPVSLAQTQNNQQQPAVTTNGRMQQMYAMTQGNQYPQMMAQPVRQLPVPVTVTSASMNGGQQHTTTPTNQPAPMQQASKPAQFEASTSNPTPAPAPQPQNPQPKTNFEKIIFPLNNMFPMYNKVQLTKVIKDVRAANGGSLSGLSIEEIIRRAADLICSQQRSAAQLQRIQVQGGRPATPVQQQQQQQLQQAAAAAVVKKPASTGPAWEPAKTVPVSAWGLSSPEGIEDDEDDEEDPCVICHEEMIMDTVTLHCGHKFHCICIKQWLQEQRTCPTCRNYTLLTDEYPAPK